MTTEKLMLHALNRKLTVKDFDDLSIGMVLDYIYEYDNLHSQNLEEDLQLAVQNDFNDF